MINRIKNLSNNPITVIVMSTLVCCWVTITVTITLFGAWTWPAVAASLGGGVLLLFWLAWSIYKLATKKSVKEMAAKVRTVLEVYSWILLIYCLSLSISSALAWIWMIPLSWLLLAGCAIYWLCQRNFR